MLKRFYSFACALGLLGMLAGSSSASTAASLLGDSRISDNSLEVLWNAGQPIGSGDTTVDVGDRLVAIGRIDQITTPFPVGTTYNFPADWNEELTFASVIQVTGKSGGGGGPTTYTFGASTTPDPLSKGWQPGTMIAFYSDASNDYTGAPGSIGAGITQASNGTPWWEFGFTGVGVPGETWTAFTITDNIATLTSLPATSTGGFFNFVLDQLAQNGGPTLFPVNITGQELTGSGNLIGSGATPPPGGFQALDNYDAHINAVPEPGSMAVFGLLGVAGLARRFRRK